MARRKSTQGVCELCKGVFTKPGMARHLPRCLAAHESETTEGKKPPTGAVPLFQILAQGRYNPEYWLYVEMPVTASLAALDRFLRHIWLECCNHLSAFKIEDTHYTSFADLDPGGSRFPSDEESMDVPVGTVLARGMKFKHDYDFGSTTKLELRVTGDREGVPADKTVRLLARNELPPILCEVCKTRPAAWVDMAQGYTWCCEQCNEGAEEEVLPVVNSPRVGVCAYTGD